MYKRDYFLRLVEQLTAVIGQLIKLEQKGDYDEALEMTDAALRQLTGLGVRAWLSLDADDILANLSMREDLGGVETAVFMVGIFFQEGEIWAVRGDQDRADFCTLKALQLQLALLNTYPQIPMPDLLPAVATLQDQLVEADVLLPPETSLALLVYYENTQAYAEAEDVLFDWIEDEPGDSRAIEAGLAFYERLLQKDDDDLRAGGLPRAEVEAGLAELLAEE